MGKRSNLVEKNDTTKAMLESNPKRRTLMCADSKDFLKDPNMLLHGGLDDPQHGNLFGFRHESKESYHDAPEEKRPTPSIMSSH